MEDVVVHVFDPKLEQEATQLCNVMGATTTS